jgi:hypothetical protein
MPTVALVFPFALLAMVSHPLSLDVPQPHPVSVVTVTPSAPPVYDAESVVLSSEKRHGAAAWLSWTVCPSTVIAADRGCGTEFAATE